jgi:hypothetical protein
MRRVVKERMHNRGRAALPAPRFASKIDFGLSAPVVVFPAVEEWFTGAKSPNRSCRFSQR